ncbi:membrane protein [Paenarthrobacter nicotinovorans]|nr:membrane protein [Paenarthrobacter nicotinovorans]
MAPKGQFHRTAPGRGTPANTARAAGYEGRRRDYRLGAKVRLGDVDCRRTGPHGEETCHSQTTAIIRRQVASRRGETSHHTGCRPVVKYPVVKYRVARCPGHSLRGVTNRSGADRRRGRPPKTRHRIGRAPLVLHGHRDLRMASLST